MMRTNIYLEEELIRECRKLSDLKTKKEIVNSALKEYVRLLKRRKMLEFEGKIEWEGNLDEKPGCTGI
jgi:Arc/MetJ family transcription regulator